jgi:fermentation-respiration switch protein FrsA (DUF1100 family)
LLGITGKIALISLICLISGYLVLIVYVYAKQGSMLYFPTREIKATPLDIGLQYEELTLRTTDRVDISAWYIPAEHPRGFLLFCHGNAGNISDRLSSIRLFHDLGLGVLIFDYRGYGKSQGSPDEEGTYRDAEAAWHYLVKTLHVSPRRVIVFGRSLGSAVAAELALRKEVRAVIMESGFTSVSDLGKQFFPHLPVKLISRYYYTSIDKVGLVEMPRLFIHSPDDEMVPYEQGVRLFERAAGPKHFLRLTGGHNEGFLLSGEAYRRGLDDFFTKYLPTEKGS